MDIDALLRILEQAKNDRSNWDAIWQDIADRVWPQMSDFTTKMRADGERRTEKMLDATAALGTQRALATFTSMFWPSNQRYQKLAADEPSTQVSQAVKQYLDDQTDTLFRVRYSPRSSFESQMGEAGLSWIVFGTGILYIEDMLENALLRRPGILYRALPLAQCYLQENANGRVDTLHRCWRWSLRQINQRFPGKLPPKLMLRLAANPSEKIEICQTVCPRADYQPGKLGRGGMPWASCYYLPSEKAFLDEGGFRSWPFAIMRYTSAPGEVYGRSPAWMALSNIRVLNTMKRTTLAAAQKVADPPLLATENEGIFSQAPGAVNYGWLRDDGRESVKPLITNANVQLSLEMMDKERDIISSAFYLDVFRALVENPQMTATQALELMQERATLMAPIGGRIESEGLGPLTERELDILAHAGQLGAMPHELVQKGGGYKIEYTSPMRQAMRASEGIAIARTLEQVLPLAQEDPSVLDAFTGLPEIARELGEINGMPAKLLTSLADLQAKKDQRVQQANAAAAVQAAPQIAAAAANLTKVQAAGGRPQL